MMTIVRNYQNDLISEILSASCFGELKGNIETIISKFISQGLPESQVTILLKGTLQELKHLNQGRLPYEQHANIISAKNILKSFRIQGSDPNDSI